MDLQQAQLQLDALGGQIALCAGSIDDNSPIISTLAALCDTLDITYNLQNRLRAEIQMYEVTYCANALAGILQPGRYRVFCETETWDDDSGGYGESVSCVGLRDDSGGVVYLPDGSEELDVEDFIVSTCWERELQEAASEVRKQGGGNEAMFEHPVFANLKFEKIYQDIAELFHDYGYDNEFHFQIPDVPETNGQPADVDSAA